MTEPGINFQTFTNKVNAKLDSMNMSAKGKAYVQGRLDSIFDMADGNQDKVLHKNEMTHALQWLNTSLNKASQMTDTEPVKPNSMQEQKQQINNPRFRGLEGYQFEQHGAKESVGAITVNGEKMLISSDGSTYCLHRYDKGEFKLDKPYEYSSIDELKKALTDKNNNFGSYSGIEDINDFFIP